MLRRADWQLSPSAIEITGRAFCRCANGRIAEDSSWKIAGWLRPDLMMAIDRLAHEMQLELVSKCCCCCCWLGISLSRHCCRNVGNTPGWCRLSLQWSCRPLLITYHAQAHAASVYALHRRPTERDYRLRVESRFMTVSGYHGFYGCVLFIARCHSTRSVTGPLDWWSPLQRCPLLPVAGICPCVFGAELHPHLSSVGESSDNRFSLNNWFT